MQFNKGEWSELYAIMALLNDKRMNIVDDCLNVIDNNTFEILGIYLNCNNIEYYYSIKDDNVEILKNNILSSNISLDEIKKYKDILFYKIIRQPPTNGSFSIPEIEGILKELTDGNKVKSSSYSKEDFNANIKDNKVNISKKLSYSIKSSLGSPATLLNASNNTNFIYLVESLTNNDVENINHIETKNKLIERFKYIEQRKCKISYVDVQSIVMKQNLQMIDYMLPDLIGFMLIESYKTGEKNIKKLLEIIIRVNPLNFDGDTRSFYVKKVGEFLLGFTLGIMPGVKWNGKDTVTGGIVVVKENGSIGLLDVIYHKDILIKYLINNTKLDSPSSSRYKMLNIYTEDGKNYFTLNLQIRFKK